MRARWLTLLVMIAGAAPVHAEPDGTCAAACRRLAQCKLSSADACIARCKRSAAETTPEGREQLVAVVRASCDQLAAAHKAQSPPSPQTQPAPPAPQTQPAPRVQPGSQTQPGPQTQPPSRVQTASAAPPARTQPAASAAPASPATPETDRQVWRCTSEGSYEILRKREIYWTPASSSAFGFGKTQQLAIIMANASCAKHMNSMMALQGITSQTRIKTPCRPTQCTPPP